MTRRCRKCWLLQYRFTISATTPRGVLPRPDDWRSISTSSFRFFFGAELEDVRLLVPDWGSVTANCKTMASRAPEIVIKS
jgi:hypothetical protein